MKMYAIRIAAFVLLIFLYLPFISGAQSTNNPVKIVNSNITDDHFRQELFIRQPDGTPFQRGYQNVTGSPYLFTKMKKVKVFLTLQKQYAEIIANLDLYSDELVYYDEKFRPLLVPKEKISEVIYSDTVDQKITVHRLINGLPPTDYLNSYDYLEVLADGKIIFLEVKKIALSESRNEMTGERNTYFEPYKDYYYYSSGKLIRYNKRESSTLILLTGDRKKEIDEFIQQNRLNPKSDQDILKIIVYYNSLY